MGGEELFVFNGGWIVFSVICVVASCVVLYFARTFQKNL